MARLPLVDFSSPPLAQIVLSNSRAHLQSNLALTRAPPLSARDFAALAVALHLRRLAIGEAIVRRHDAHGWLVAAAVEHRRAEGSAQLQLELRAIARRHLRKRTRTAPDSVRE